MIYLKEVVRDESMYLVPLGDLHLEDKYFTDKSESKLREQIDWVRQRDNARVFLTGDVFNVATRTSKTSPFHFNKTIQTKYDGDQMAFALDLFNPIKEKIIGAIDGNHEHRTIDFCNRSWITELCGKLSTKDREVKYCGDSCLLFLKIGESNRSGAERSAQTYVGYIHHTTGGGGTMGSKMNRVGKLEDMVVACDFYVGAHNHMKGAATLGTFVPNINNCIAIEIEQTFIDSGGFLDYGGYVERYQLKPTTIGAPIIEFFSDRKGLNVTI